MSISKSLAAIAGLSGILFVSGSALASSAPYSATLVKPLAASQEVVLDSVIFECSGTTCTEATRDEDAALPSVCHQLVRHVGAVSAYGTEAKPFDTDKLAKCNSTN